VVETTTKNIWAITFSGERERESNSARIRQYVWLSRTSLMKCCWCLVFKQSKMCGRCISSSKRERNVACRIKMSGRRRRRKKIWIEIDNGYWFSNKRFLCLTTTHISIKKGFNSFFFTWNY
jgi:hypothetical protein